MTELMTGIKHHIPQGSLFFAPMEGVTDELYRNLILDLYPEWDYIFTDFLRIPSTGHYTNTHMMEHYGQSVFDNHERRSKTVYQILTSDNALTESHVTQITAMGHQWLDLNLGCPSKTVCKNKGGSYLLTDKPALSKIIKTIRNCTPHMFTVKMRVGYHDDKDFLSLLSLLQDHGVDAITIHARTRDQLYTGVANWDYVKMAVKHCQIPIIGNGDIWSPQDIERYFDYTNSHAVMLARSALKTPWLARLSKSGQMIEAPEVRAQELLRYFFHFYQALQKIEDMPEESRLKRMKSVCRYVFDDFSNGDQMRKRFLLSNDVSEMFCALKMPPMIEGTLEELNF